MPAIIQFIIHQHKHHQIMLIIKLTKQKKAHCLMCGLVIKCSEIIEPVHLLARYIVMSSLHYMESDYLNSV